ncbi:MAG: exo-alpha-sialidase [Verrucomicrobia bacterium]|nr:exo-alpha-sialidase [Verrucomicrobiota bacterium]
MNLQQCFVSGLLGVVAVATAVVGRAASAPPSSAKIAGRRVLDLPPGPNNPRNSEGAFATLKDGKILFVYSHFVGTSSADAAKARLAFRTSADEGETWSGDTFIATPEEDQVMNVMSVSLLRHANGDLGLFYLLRRSWHDMRMVCRRSTDEGQTWSAPIVCMPAAGYYVVNNDRVLRLASGRLLIPAALHRALADRNESSAVDWRGVAEFFLSDDDGRTWRRAPGFGTLPVAHTRSGLQEPGVIELAPGQLWAWARTDLGRQYEMFSIDNGETWSVPAPSRFTSPNSPLSLKAVPGSGRLVALWNPGAAYETRPMRRIGGDRTPLVLATGRTAAGAWSRAAILDGDDPAVDAGFCYTAIHFTKDAMLLAYCAGNESDKSRLARIRIVKVALTALP